MNDIRFHPVRPLVDLVMFHKLDKRGVILYVVLVCVLLPFWRWWLGRMWIMCRIGMIDTDS
jgi:hypothetical protein